MADLGLVKAPRRIGWYYGWNILGLAVLSQMIGLGLALNCFTLFLSHWRHDFNMPASSLTLAVTIFALGCALLCAVAGWASDRFPARWLLAAGLSFLALIHVAVGLATAGWQIVLLYGLAAIGIAFSSGIPCQALVSRWFVRRRGLALGVSAVGIGVAQIIFPPIVVWVQNQIGWRGTWLAYAAVIALVVVPAIVFGVRDRPSPSDGTSYVGEPETGASSPTLTMMDIMRRPNFWIIGGAFACIYCAYQALVINLAPIVGSHGLGLATAGLLISGIGIVDLVGKIVAGVAVDGVGNRVPLVATGLIGAVGAFLMVLAPGTIGLVSGCLMVGLGGAIWTLLASATAAEFGRDGFGRAYGLIATFTPLGSIAPPILAWTQERTGSYAVGLIGLGIISLVGAVAALLLNERPAQKGPAASLAAA